MLGRKAIMANTSVMVEDVVSIPHGGFFVGKAKLFIGKKIGRKASQSPTGDFLLGRWQKEKLWNHQ